MRLLPETLPAQAAREGLLAGVRAYVHVHRVLVLEALRAYAAVVQRSLLPDAVARRRGVLDRRLRLGAAVRPLVLLGRRLGARHHRRGDLYGGAEVVQYADLIGANTVHGIVGGRVDLAVLVHGLGHLVRDALQLLEVLGERVVELGEQEVVHVVRTRRVVLRLGHRPRCYLLLEYYFALKQIGSLINQPRRF